jgi:phosphoglycolate phosphatase-like HAD superfamily hydrolase
MDGTLTVPRLDFDAIKRDMGIQGQSILEALGQLQGQRLARALEVLDRHESEAAHESELAGGTVELLDELEARQIPTALVTRNSMACARVVMNKHGLRLPVVVARECSEPKPHPNAAHTALARLGLKLPNDAAGRQRIWVVGDGEFDVELAHATGLKAIWLSLGRNCPPIPAPHLVIETLYDLIALLRRTA